MITWFNCKWEQNASATRCNWILLRTRAMSGTCYNCNLEFDWKPSRFDWNQFCVETWFLNRALLHECQPVVVKYRVKHANYWKPQIEWNLCGYTCRCQRPIKTNGIGNKSLKCHPATYCRRNSFLFKQRSHRLKLHICTRRSSFDRMIHLLGSQVGQWNWRRDDFSKAPSLAYGVNKFPERMAPG